MNIRLFVFDWDGTALGGHEPYDRFPAEFAGFLDALSDRGIAWATNSTWAVETQYKVIKASGVKSLPVFLAGATGRSLARVTRHGLSLDRLYERRIKSSDRLFSRQFGPAMRRLAAQLLKKGLAEQLYFNPYGQPSLTISFAGKDEARQGWRLAGPLFNSGAVYRMTGANEADTILPLYMNKGAVITHMQRRLGLKAEETMVAGDGWNDRHMFSAGVAGGMICPANAHPGIKALVRKHDGIIGRRRYSWGVMEAAEKLINKQEAKKHEVGHPMV